MKLMSILLVGVVALEHVFPKFSNRKQMLVQIYNDDRHSVILSGIRSPTQVFPPTFPLMCTTGPGTRRSTVWGGVIRHRTIFDFSFFALHYTWFTISARSLDRPNFV